MTMREIHREHFIKHRPNLYHVSLASNLQSVQRHGLLSTSALLDLFQTPAQERELYEARPRPERVALSHQLHGKAYLNDQSVLNEKGLAKCLVQMSPDEWCRILNSRVFFWPGKDLGGGVWEAKLGRTYKRIVFVADTREFLREYEYELEASPINAGYTMRDPSPRGAHTFRPLQKMFDEPSFSVGQVKELCVLRKVTQTHLLKIHELSHI